MKCRDDVEPKKTIDSKTQNYIQNSKAMMHSEQLSTNEMMKSRVIRAFPNTVAERKVCRAFAFSNNVILCI